MARRSTATARDEHSGAEPLVNLNARIPKRLWERVRRKCHEEGRLLRVYITEALEEHLRSRTRGARVT